MADFAPNMKVKNTFLEVDQTPQPEQLGRIRSDPGYYQRVSARVTDDSFQNPREEGNQDEPEKKTLDNCSWQTNSWWPEHADISDGDTTDSACEHPFQSDYTGDSSPERSTQDSPVYVNLVPVYGIACPEVAAAQLMQQALDLRFQAWCCENPYATETEVRQRRREMEMNATFQAEPPDVAVAQLMQQALDLRFQAWCCENPNATETEVRQRRREMEMNATFQAEARMAEADNPSGTRSNGKGGNTKSPNASDASSQDKAENPQATDVSNTDKTTVMLKNIPNNYTRQNLWDLMDSMDSNSFKGAYNFLYLPMDHVKKSNLGYAFVNFVSVDDANRFFAFFPRFNQWGAGFKSTKVGEVSWGTENGLDDHIARYRNSPVMHDIVPEECKPMILRDGVQEPFPPKTKRIRPPRGFPKEKDGHTSS